MILFSINYLDNKLMDMLKVFFLIILVVIKVIIKRLFICFAKLLLTKEKAL